MPDHDKNTSSQQREFVRGWRLVGGIVQESGSLLAESEGGCGIIMPSRIAEFVRNGSGSYGADSERSYLIGWLATTDTGLKPD